MGLLLGVVLVIAGCSPRGAQKSEPPSGFGNGISGISMRTINVGGLDRVYRLYKPVGLPASAPPIVMLHDGFGSAEQAERAYGWDQLADSGKFILVFRAYPDGLNRAWLIPYSGGQGFSVISGPSTAGCTDNRGVVLVTVDGGGHQWPPFATQSLWEFFAAHPK